MEEVNNESKNAVIKTLAIIGFIAAIIFGLWIAVQGVRYVPTAFSTLASIADSINSSEEEFVVTTEKNIVNSGEAFSVMWTELRENGTYVFSYRCTEGVSAEARNSDGDIVALSCDSELPVAEDTTDVDVIFSSEKRRFTDIPFSVGFMRDGDDEAAFEKNSLITVVNASISQSAEIVLESEERLEPSEEPVEDTPTTGNTPTPRTPVRVPTVPVSDPNGFVDLKVTYLGVGSFNASTETFTPRATLDNDQRGAVRFEVQNIGTKTSGIWIFESELPTSPRFDYTSENQAALRPSERSVITLGFNDLASAGSHKIEATVIEASDRNTANNSFNWSVEVVE